MRWLRAVRERRLAGVIGTYAVGGFVALEGVDQAVGHGLLPSIAYVITLIFYLFGFPASLIVGWFHGPKGTQKIQTLEILLLSVVAIAALTVNGFVTTRHLHNGVDSSLIAIDGELSPRRVAVLYFDDVSSNGGMGYLADGLTESLVGELATVRALDVVSINGVAAYRGSRLAIDSIARLLDAGTIVKGSVVDVANGVGVTVRLLDGVSGADVERARFDVAEERPLAGVDSVVSEVAEMLRRWIGDEVRLRTQRQRTAEDAAWILAQRAKRERMVMNRLFTEDHLDGARAALKRADSLFQQAESTDAAWPDPVVARGWLAYEWSRLRSGNAAEARSFSLLAVEHANRALDLASDHYDALTLRGTASYWQTLIGVPATPDEAEALAAAARADLERAVDLNADQARAHNVLSHLYAGEGRAVDALLAAQRAYNADAYLEFSPDVLWRLFLGHYDVRQPRDARRWCTEGYRRFPDNYRFSLCRIQIMTTDAAEPDVDEAWRLRDDVERLAPGEQRPLQARLAQLWVGGVVALAGMPDSAGRVLTAARPSPGVDPDNTLAFFEAHMRILAGQEDEAIDRLKIWLGSHPDQDHGLEAGDMNWWWEPLRDHPRFPELVRGGS